MTNPQLENGYTRIANELLEKIYSCDLNGTQLKIILCLWRQTYGFQRKEHSLSVGFISKAIGRHEKQVAQELKYLISIQIVEVATGATFTQSRKLSFNKKCSEWWQKEGEGVNTLPPNEKDTITGSENTTPTGSEFTPQRKKGFKESIKDTIEHFFEEVWKLYPRKRGKSAVSKKSKRELYSSGMDVVAAAIEKYKSETDGREEQYILQGSTFFNGRWKDYIPQEKKAPVEQLEDGEEENRFKNLPTEIYEEYKALGIITSEAGIDYGIATPEQLDVLRGAGVI